MIIALLGRPLKRGGKGAIRSAHFQLGAIQMIGGGRGQRRQILDLLPHDALRLSACPPRGRCGADGKRPLPIGLIGSGVHVAAGGAGEIAVGAKGGREDVPPRTLTTACRPLLYESASHVMPPAQYFAR